MYIDALILCCKMLILICLFHLLYIQDDSVGEIFLEYQGLWPTIISK